VKHGKERFNMRLIKTLVFGVAAALLLWGPSVAMATTGRWIKEGPGNAGIYETSSGWEEYMPSHSALDQKPVPRDYAPPLPMNPAQKATGARLTRDLHQAFEAIGL
jgi:hypothetical protein